MSDFKNLSGVTIERISLFTKFGEVTLKDIFESIHIYESLTDPCMSGDISIFDSQYMSHLLEITGGEKLVISYASSMYNETKELTFYVYKMSERYHIKESTTAFKLYFCSQELLTNALQSNSFSITGFVYEIIEKLLKDKTIGLGSDKKLEYEQDAFSKRYVIPYWKPFTTIDFLKRRAASSEFFGSPYLFFETPKGFFFKSYAKLFTGQVKQEYVYAPILDNSSYRDLDSDKKKISNYYIKSNIDILKSILDGAYSSRMYLFDLTSKKLHRYDYDYFGENAGDSASSVKATGNLLEKQKLINDIDIAKQASSKIIVSYEQQFAYDDVKYGSIQKADYPETYVQVQESIANNLDKIALEVTTNGDSEISVGDIINFSVPIGEGKEDKQLSGRYLIASLCHVIKDTSYMMKMEIIKNTVQENYTDVTKIY